MTNKDMNHVGSKLTQSLSFNEALESLHKAKNEIAVNKPVARYTNYSSNLLLARNSFLGASGTATVIVVLSFFIPSTPLLFALISGSLSMGSALVADIAMHIKSPRPMRGKIYDWFLSKKAKDFIVKNQRAYREYHEGKRIWNAYIEFKRKELTDMGVFQRINGKMNRAGYYYVLNNNGEVDILHPDKWNELQNSYKAESDKAQFMLKEMISKHQQLEK